MDEVLNRIDDLERKLDHILKALGENSQDSWVDSREFCRLVGLKDTKALVYQMSKGVILGDAIRNIGTIQRPRYRFHRIRAVNQFLKRASTPPVGTSKSRSTAAAY
jgi:hypothetical protein